MSREKRILGHVLIILAGAMMVLLSLNKPAIAADNIFSLFVPPLTDKEKALYKKIGNDKKKIERFVETRLFMRKVALFVAELPKGVEFNLEIHGSPQPSKNVDIEYTLTFDEQLLLFNICLLCGNCVCRDCKNEATGHPSCGLSHPKGFDCGVPVGKDSVFSQLTPPVSQEEIQLFEKANNCPSWGIPRFLATRKYMRQINKLMAALPAGKKFDPRTAPPMPEQIDGHYLLGDEVWIILGIQQAQLEDMWSPRR